MKMATTLPIEILMIIAKYASRSLLPRLSLVSREIYSITMPLLYASIPDLSKCMPRTIRCLLTLSTKPELARMVYSFSLTLSQSHALRAFHRLISRALSNMTSLGRLSIHSTVPICSILSQMSCQLTELSYYSLPSDLYPVSNFLSTQPTIEKLNIICQADGLSNLAPNALPALRSLSAPVELLLTPLLSHLSRPSRLSVLHAMTNVGHFAQLARALREITSPRPLELLVGIDTSTNPGAVEVASLGLACLAPAAPFVTSLNLNILRGYIQPDELHDIFAFALPRFPNLKTFTMMSPPPYEITYTRDFQMRQLSHTISLIYGELSSLQLPIDTPLPLPAMQSEPGPAQHQPNSDALHDQSCHTKMLREWGQIHPGLECVIFPGALYNLEAFRWD
ncbi:unnamed protein product [Rhizoctonia solani]|uniref:F-box domain-containing protein n=1 Tax=Rhizoctonia solani TaxID=456999 RepID=A0A8H3CYP0_9AGAM|nr:unnamed protein product [Rhizoctonia solani]